ncbi:hypothetical protein L6164_010599 [Bauhinia variegata]|uniref:Uncharacterized protein n=1 Tax=Bauhinia variegata TaxID=167791 RepID=A0ACB9PNS4_BAUVA|nr:hypothetical protein L6164_010599 [Bauhinia variegata]
MSLLSSSSSPFQLLEINLISAQQLAPVAKGIRAYAVAWLHPDRKLSTRLDQNGDVDPTWNEKFLFRVDDEFLNAQNSLLMVEIYASAWLKDILIGTVAVNVNNVLPPSARSTNRKPKSHYITLQVRRPSGRPQGILNIGVSLLDSSMRSMPLCSELSASAVGYEDHMTVDKQKNHPNYHEDENEMNHKNLPKDSKLVILQRSQSEKGEFEFYPMKPEAASTCNSSVVNGASQVGVPQKGIVNANGSLCSDVGPSPSVVAAAIAKGIYPISYPVPQPNRTGGSVIYEWSENNSTERMKTRLERWRTELPPVYDHLTKSTPKRVGQTPRRRRSRSGLFSCFGTAYGCEFAITCGGGNQKKKHNGGSKAHLTASELTYDESSYL